jgi:DNA/RNA endonuclease YhcR with UshA esterase domain
LKTLRFWLAAIVAIALAAGSLAEADSPTTAPDSTQPSTQPSFTADQRDALIAANGSDVTVTGVVSQIRGITDRVLKISFNGVDRNGFCGIVFADKAPTAHDYFDKGAGAAIVGKEITISGTVSLYHGNPEIIIGDAKQVVVLGPGAATRP